jgi:hypothetical protein
LEDLNSRRSGFSTSEASLAIGQLILTIGEAQQHPPERGYRRVVFKIRLLGEHDEWRGQVYFSKFPFSSGTSVAPSTKRSVV